MVLNSKFNESCAVDIHALVSRFAEGTFVFARWVHIRMRLAGPALLVSALMVLNRTLRLCYTPGLITDIKT